MENYRKELEIALTSYIALKHNQDECAGFIDGFKAALEISPSCNCTSEYTMFNEENGLCNVCGKHA